jgi:siroheme synthase-like protein
MIPVFLDMRGRRVVIFGGGPVGRRKAEHFLPEAEVVIVTRAAESELAGMALRVVEADALDVLVELLPTADLVIAATNDRTVNARIVEEAARLGIYCNSADLTGSFLIPSTVRREGIEIAISTLGRSPAMARYLRLQLEEMIGPQHERMLCILEEARQMAKERLPSQLQRERALREIVSDQEIWGLLAEDPEEGRCRALRKVMDLG